MRERIEKSVSLVITDGWRFAFIGAFGWPFHAFDGIVGDGVVITQVIKEGRQG